jgi:hypothetical protein
MLCGRCCVTEPPTKLALRLDIFIEILPRTTVNRGVGDLAGPPPPTKERLPLTRHSRAEKL